jgi:ATP-dependent Clp endopeptidase proteolytic subunit ClpP
LNDSDGSSKRGYVSANLEAAEIHKNEAEAERSIAEARKASAEARKASAEAEECELDVRSASIKVRKAEREERDLLAGDEYYHIYRFIGHVDGSSVEKCMSKLTQWSRLNPGCDIEVIFHSPGGAVIAGLALFDFLRSLSDSGHKITTGATGMAASMGGILIQSGDHRWMSAEAWYMIHRAAFGAAGKVYEIEDEVEWVKRIEKRIIKIFSSRSTLTPRRIKRNWDRKDWWLDSDQCLEMGLVDEVRGKSVLITDD